MLGKQEVNGEYGYEPGVKKRVTSPYSKGVHGYSKPLQLSTR